MKTIGLIGGMSWESSAEYYRIINEEIKRRLGDFHSAKCLLYSVDFAENQRYQAQGEWGKAGEALAEVGQSLQKGGADFIVICTNTMHKVVDQIEDNVDIPVLHIADATTAQIHRDSVKKVGLLGTKYTMEQDFYKTRLEKNGLEVVVPDAEDRNIIHSVIYAELCQGTINASSKENFKQIIHKLIDNGAQGIILGCTEIGLLIKPEDVEVPTYDTARIHAVEAVNNSLE
ncbi:aspartate/glutamate racemase family protein [Pseudalkalibacillus berkeleyi]|uniref:Aspartate/glutamate racemase family protein n=1 Tax=Pseudalkalibacillus berkeleyi TaxID=1069813 RepID=A0ABS9GV06_9BACL|nr:aspartate/glutamate racemase family protein [Pseudalkalibacillus berkeleyi]MCF6136662.1 aspartate/glutamate racemase family protein [Pseudalkalibacillus berkeleyi]